MVDTQLFLVRVWQDAARFRASVRAADDEEPRLFTAPALLADFLAHASGAASPTTNSPTGVDDEDHP